MEEAISGHGELDVRFFVRTMMIDDDGLERWSLERRSLERWMSGVL